ncbi:MAG TPA: 4-hydroxybenzoate 3-monooxygenase, partial [Chryseolinea sp.]
AGLTLALLLERAGIQTRILESRSREYVESRARAGLLEQNTVDLFNDLNVAERLNREGLKHLGVILSFNGERCRVPFDSLAEGRVITIYGQQEVLKDLIKSCVERNIKIEFEAEVKRAVNIDSAEPEVFYRSNSNDQSISCDVIAGCDGYHGISRKLLPENSYTEYTKDYPFSWLGILAYAPPATEELIYSYHERGFALHSLRSESVSRLYLQVSNNDSVANWTDDQIWNELDIRLADHNGFKVNRGEIFEKAITPMRSFMIDNMQYGRLFLAGDAAHIVPPTGGKGLNLAVADVKWLASALIEWYKSGDESLLNSYSANCLRRIWRAQDFSNFMTYLFHKQAPHGSFDYHLQRSRFEYIGKSVAQAATIAENYVGLKEI